MAVTYPAGFGAHGNTSSIDSEIMARMIVAATSGAASTEMIEPSGEMIPK